MTPTPQLTLFTVAKSVFCALIHLCIICAATSAFLTQASAQPVLLFDNGGPSYSDAFVSDLAGGFQYGDDFTLGSAASVGEITWAGGYKLDSQLYQGTDDFSIRIFGLNGNTPGNTPIVQLNVGAVQRNLLSGTLPPYNTLMYNYEAAFSPVALSAGSYMLSIVDNSTGNPGPWMWDWSGGGGPVWFRTQDNAAWNGPYSNDMSFQLYSVPEPRTYQLITIAFLLIKLTSRRRGSYVA